MEKTDTLTPAHHVRSPARFSQRALFDVTKRTLAETAELDTSLRCAGVAFFSFLSLFPALAAAVAIYALFADPLSINEQVAMMSALMPETVVKLFETQMKALAGREQSLGIGLAISLVLALWSGSRGVNALVHAITRAHLETRDRNFVRAALMSFAFTIAGFALMAFLIGAIAIIPIATSLLPLPQGQETLALWLRWPVAAITIFAAIFILFAKAPHRTEPRKRWVMPGAILSTILWIGGSIAFSFYIENFANYNATFGSIAAAAVLMLWLYVSALVLVLGAILNAQLEYQTAADTTVGPPKPMGSRGAFVADNIVGADADHYEPQSGGETNEPASTET
ncbi:YihY/virulence factor BrkB family protein [Oricola cellulosilytica]|uniref:YihY/virulence factor BrkB family protein n=1 Tax=Oricola cellulosilytica TaxID=1429082 RepID=A0A4R0PFA0_9HYPH|nr:YihY/virulence factor BrkB family protein [Oricola cellulosilytica]TCD15075.1 YihY/virulence factor BrkB family protein [Oricola cellulosilytica]